MIETLNTAILFVGLGLASDFVRKTLGTQPKKYLTAADIQAMSRV